MSCLPWGLPLQVDNHDVVDIQFGQRPPFTYGNKVMRYLKKLVNPISTCPALILALHISLANQHQLGVAPARCRCLTCTSCREA